MKLFKYDYTGAIGNNVVTVPTDSQFLVGISNGQDESDVELYDGATEIPAEENKVGKYTCSRFETDGEPSRKPYKAVITPKEVIVKNLWAPWLYTETPYKGFEGIYLAIEEGVTPLDINFDPDFPSRQPAVKSFKAYFYGEDPHTSKLTYLESATLTWQPVSYCYSVFPDTPQSMLDYKLVKYIQFSEAASDYMYYCYGFSSSQLNMGDGDTDGTWPIPFTIAGTPVSLDLIVDVKKQSIAYRDLEGKDPIETIENASEVHLNQPIFDNPTIVGSIKLEDGTEYELVKTVLGQVASETPVLMLVRSE
jgi:hypothetical protein